MEVLGVKDSVEGVRSVMSDGVHLNKDAWTRWLTTWSRGSRSCRRRRKGDRPKGRARRTRSRESPARLPLMGGVVGGAAAVGAGGGGAGSVSSPLMVPTKKKRGLLYLWIGDPGKRDQSWDSWVSVINCFFFSHSISVLFCNGYGGNIGKIYTH